MKALLSFCLGLVWMGFCWLVWGPNNLMMYLLTGFGGCIAIGILVPTVLWRD